MGRITSTARRAPCRTDVYKRQALDVSAEADALKAVLSQEGLVEGGLAVHAAPKTEEKER